MTFYAEYDIEYIFDYIANKLKNPIVATNIIKGIYKKIELLQIYPKKNKLDNDILLAKAGVRTDYYKNYKICYVLDEKIKTVYVVRILHMLMNSQETLYRTIQLRDRF